MSNANPSSAGAAGISATRFDLQRYVVYFGFLAIFSGIALLVDDAQMRTIGAALGVSMALLILATAIAGLFRADSVVGIPQPLGATLGGADLPSLVRDVSSGLYVSIVAGVIATVSSVLAVRERAA